MTALTVATFNLKNLALPDADYYPFDRWSAEEAAWRTGWVARQIVAMNADVVAFQEVFDLPALAAAVAEADRIGTASNATLTGSGNPQGPRRPYRAYGPAALTHAPNAHDGPPGRRKLGLAVLSRLPVTLADAEQDLDPPLEIALQDDAGGDPAFRIARLGRPQQRLRLRVAGREVTLFNCHLKSKLPAFRRADPARPAPEEDLLSYDALGRQEGSLRSGLRRMAEALVLRRRVLAELAEGRAVIVAGDFNDTEEAVSTRIITGEAPFRDYTWLRRPGAATADDRYTRAEDKAIREAIEAVRLHAAERLLQERSLADLVYTTNFDGVFESIDHILLSRQFIPGQPGAFGRLDYYRVLNDHLKDEAHRFAPHDSLVSDHGQAIAHLWLDPPGGA